MTAAIRYVAVKPLTLQDAEGGRLVVQRGQDVPAQYHGRWLELAVEAGKVVESAAVNTASPSLLTDAQLRDELRERGYRVTKSK